MFLESEAPMETDIHFQSFISISFGVTSKEALPPGSLHRAPLKRDAPFLETSFIHLSKSLVYKPPPRFPSGVPMERDAHLQTLPLHILQGPHRFHSTTHNIPRYTMNYSTEHTIFIPIHLSSVILA